MSYDDWNSLNDLDVATPLDGASPQELLAAFRQLKAVVKNALLASHYPNGKLRAGSVTKVAENSVGFEQLLDKAVGAQKIADNTITADQLANGAVGSDQLADGAVTQDKYGAESIPASAYKANTIPLTALAQLITAQYLSSSEANNDLRSVTEWAIADEAVTDRAIKSVAVGKLTGGDNNAMLLKVNGTWTGVVPTGDLTFDPVLQKFVASTGLGVVVVADTKPRGTSGGPATTDTWVLRTLGELSDERNLASFSANKFKLVPGKYFIFISCPAYNIGRHQARLFDVTNTQVVAWGTSVESTAAGITSNSIICGFFEVTDANTEYQIEHWVQTAAGSNDFGVAASSNNSTPYTSHREVYTFGFAIKIA